MKTLTIAVIVVLSIAVFSGAAAVAFGQVVPEPQQIAILKAEKALADRQKEASDIRVQWSQLQDQAKTIQNNANDLDKKLRDTQQDLQNLIDGAAKTLKLDPAKVDFNHDTLTFTSKPEAKPAPPAAPVVEKK